MADGVVSGGGSIAVATDELFAEAHRLGLIETALGDWRVRLDEAVRRLGHAESASGTVGYLPGASLTSADADLTTARHGLSHALATVGELRRSLTESAERYGTTERMVDAAWSLGGGMAAWALGVGARIMLPLLLPGAIGLAIGRWIGLQAAGRGDRDGGDPLGVGAVLADPTVSRLLRGAAEAADPLLASPLGAKALGTALDSGDEFLGGLLLGGPPVLGALGSRWRAPESAAMLMGTTARLPAGTPLREDRAVATRAGAAGIAAGFDASAPARGDRAPVPSEAVAAPQTLAELADRIPAGGHDGAQIRIERYGDGDDRRWIVYVGGTVDFSPTPGREAADMTNNVANVAGTSWLGELRADSDDGALARAVREAMDDAGVRPGDPVLPVGYSGGGIVAAGMAGDPGVSARAVLTLGSPVGTAELGGTPLLALRHDEDPVPMSGGLGAPSPDRLEYRSSAFDPGERHTVVAAHELTGYRGTAAEADAAEDPRLVALRERIAGFAGDSTGAAMFWRAERVVTPSTGG